MSDFLFTLGVFNLELSLVKYGQKSKVWTVLKTSGSQLFKTVLTFNHVLPEITQIEKEKENQTFLRNHPSYSLLNRFKVA